MCGIAGYFGKADIPEERTRACLALMGRRGPDYAAVKRWAGSPGPNAVLLHSRLSIIDLDPRSHQPLAVGSKWIVFNGELYNYVELRRTLERGRRAFRTTSDTEVLLSALDTFGEAALDRCEGMWAFAVYDEADGSLLLSRDRFGEKPLYVYREAGGIYFGSEAKFIFALLGRRLEINPDHLFRYLVNGYKALYKKAASFFRGLSEVPPGTVLRLNGDGAETSSRYWRPPTEVDETMTREKAVAGTRERLIRAVELRLRADVPLAFCMSGGIDSNALVAIAKRVFAYDVHGFTIVNTDARYEEQAQVECSVRELGIRHTRVSASSGSFLDRLRELVR
ncbi:MAG TPA: asparagine synthase (glutamine-hydrolyzing), partial [Planctomycetota bacterium]|nr:asparagine synthase (glutamine-hydrolyzing) [Planctomycetota bacterium]